MEMWIFFPFFLISRGGFTATLREVETVKGKEIKFNRIV